MNKLLWKSGIAAATLLLMSCAADVGRFNQAVAQGRVAPKTETQQTSRSAGGDDLSAGVVRAIDEPTLLTVDEEVMRLCVPLDVDAEYVVPGPWEDAGAHPGLDSLADCLREASRDMHGFELIGSTSLPGHLAHPTEGHGRGDWMRQVLSEHGVPFEGFIVTPAEHVAELGLVDNQVHLRLAS